MTRVFLLDDHEIVRRGLAELLGSEPDLEIVGQAGTAAAGLREILALRPDVAVLDVRLPDGSGIDVCRDVRSRDPGIRCLILTAYDDDEALSAAVIAGAAGYVLKDIRGKGLVDVVRAAAAGDILLDPAIVAAVAARLRGEHGVDPRLAGLTERERRILALIADGMTNRQIGVELSLAEKTIKNYVSSVLSKLGLERRTQAAVLQTELRPPSPR
ncbi:DNA-binding response regulator [Rathayibacter caricis DSM 15933]|jgi:two-component system response regulator DevR|uniref:DNA-binding response regulator n=1 Tax=Rathayibacter caricis DSM 15933 TaxID=1328867 RepID=A0A2T4UPR1_9MICO|nr:response regulator transcription factor [Rathayibacter caricis]MCJ1696557.1 response regulator transcription factor [Rathayibacter caricis]PTL71516.1 DNA-binding response regulator [Rathayibacter caricis DSM 15933]